MTVEYQLLLKDRWGRLKMSVTFYGDTYDQFQSTDFWPNGKMASIVTGKTDDLLAALKTLREEREQDAGAD